MKLSLWFGVRLLCSCLIDLWRDKKKNKDTSSWRGQPIPFCACYLSVKAGSEVLLPCYYRWMAILFLIYFHF